MPSLRKLTAVGCYIFAGGFTIGVRKHFSVNTHLEGNPPYGASVAVKNLGVEVYAGSENWPADDLAGRVDFLYGNPPCAAWSHNNSKSHKAGSWEKDPRVNCTREFFNLLPVVNPKVWAWESVCAAPAKGKSFVDELTRNALALGYSVSQVFHDAQYCGTPQVRRRWFLVCHRVKYQPTKPDFKKITVAEAIRGVTPRGTEAYDVTSLKSIVSPYFSVVSEGQTLRDFWGKNIPCKKRPDGVPIVPVGLGHRKLRADSPANATVGYAMVHPTEHRFLHLNEVQALAGFPQSFDFGGSGSYARELDLLGRGVCPPVGEWLARGVAKAVRDNIRVISPRVTVYDFRKPGVDPVDVTSEYEGVA